MHLQVPHPPPPESPPRWTAVLFRGSESRLKETISSTATLQVPGHTKERIIVANFRVLGDFGAVLFRIVATVAIRPGPPLVCRRACAAPGLAGFSPGGRLGRDVLRPVAFVVVAVLGLAPGIIAITKLALSRVSWMHASIFGLRSTARPGWQKCEPFVGRAMDFRARAERLGAFGVASVSLIVAGVGPNGMLGGGRVQRLWRSFKHRVRHSSSARRRQCRVE